MESVWRIPRQEQHVAEENRAACRVGEALLPSTGRFGKVLNLRQALGKMWQMYATVARVYMICCWINALYLKKQSCYMTRGHTYTLHQCLLRPCMGLFTRHADPVQNISLNAYIKNAAQCIPIYFRGSNSHKHRAFSSRQLKILHVLKWAETYKRVRNSLKLAALQNLYTDSPKQKKKVIKLPFCNLLQNIMWTSP